MDFEECEECFQMDFDLGGEVMVHLSKSSDLPNAGVQITLFGNDTPVFEGRADALITKAEAKAIGEYLLELSK